MHGKGISVYHMHCDDVADVLVLSKPDNSII